MRTWSWTKIVTSCSLTVMLVSGNATITSASPSTLTDVHKKIETKHYLEREKSIVFPNEDRYWIKRIQNKPGSNQKFQTIRYFIPGNTGVYKYKAFNGGELAWQEVNLSGSLPYQTGYITTDYQSVIMSQPQVYIPRSHHSMEVVPTYNAQIKINAQKTFGGYNIIVTIPLESNMFGEIWALTSAHELIDWDKKNMELIWKGLDFEGNLRWSWDGFYARTPSSYTPTGKNYFFRNPDNYFANSFIITNGSRAATDLGWMMMHTILPNQNSQGYWITPPQSEWLFKDYGIQAGFYDTRFNTDIAYLLLKGYQKYNDPRLFDSTKRYAEFFLAYSETNQFKITKNGREGILVADYTHESPHKITHSSLNHHLMEMIYLYEMYLQTKDERYRKLADKMLWGVKLTRDKWVMPNSNLHYAYLPNGKMGLSDYPFLTYNDLYKTQNVLMKVYNWRDEDLDYLMHAKREWMDANGVKGYLK
ncbi:hypothetical protein [Brevibacillus daliensis]|uniref:hypothetical protein n=1 Tax=Brevibacillus daliensis TaxID=2892995 RepID=UPI001E3BF5E1|nr:hypothetical protein [Brevibacillus daliensis]